MPALKLRGPYFGLVTLVAVLLMQNMLVLFAGFTGGEIGLDIPDILSIDDKWNYWCALIFMSVSGYSCRNRLRRGAHAVVTWVLPRSC